MTTTDSAAIPDAPRCHECELPAPNPSLDFDGRPLCAACIDAYYVRCGACEALVPKDSAAADGDASVCPACLEARAVRLQIPSNEEATALVDEYLALAVEKKRVDGRMEEIKERLKLAATVRERAGNAVVIRGDGGAVRCSFSQRVNVDADKALALETVLGADLFDELFERKTTVKANAKAVLRLLDPETPADDDVREAVRSAVEVVESSMLTTRS